MRNPPLSIGRCEVRNVGCQPASYRYRDQKQLGADGEGQAHSRAANPDSDPQRRQSVQRPLPSSAGQFLNVGLTRLQRDQSLVTGVGDGDNSLSMRWVKSEVAGTPQPLATSVASRRTDKRRAAVARRSRRRSWSRWASLNLLKWVKKAHPAVAMAADADRRLLSYLTHFGMTPAVRSKVQAIGEPPSKDPEDEYIN